MEAKAIYNALVGKELEATAAQQMLDDDFSLQDEIVYVLDSAWRIEEDADKEIAILELMEDEEALDKVTEEVKELCRKAIAE